MVCTSGTPRVQAGRRWQQRTSFAGLFASILPFCTSDIESSYMYRARAAANGGPAHISFQRGMAVAVAYMAAAPYVNQHGVHLALARSYRQAAADGMSRRAQRSSSWYMKKNGLFMVWLVCVCRRPYIFCIGT